MCFTVSFPRLVPIPHNCVLNIHLLTSHKTLLHNIQCMSDYLISQVWVSLCTKQQLDNILTSIKCCEVEGSMPILFVYKCVGVDICVHDIVCARV